eukprot:bmy_11748T0
MNVAGQVSSPAPLLQPAPGPLGKPSTHRQKPEEPPPVPLLWPRPNSEAKAGPTEGVTSVRVGRGQGARVPHAAYLVLFVLSQHSHETQRPALVPFPEGHLRDHPEGPAAVPGLPPAHAPGERLEERQHRRRRRAWAREPEQARAAGCVRAHAQTGGRRPEARYLRLLLAIPAVIMSDTAVEQKRALIRRKKREQIGTQPPGAQGLTEEQQMMIRELITAQMKTSDSTFTHFKNFRLMSQLPEVLSSAHKIRSLCRLSQVKKLPSGARSGKIYVHCGGKTAASGTTSPQPTIVGKRSLPCCPTWLTRQPTCSKASSTLPKSFSYFRDLLIEDQISLLKGATFELCQLRFNTVFNAETRTWECGQLSYCLETLPVPERCLSALAEGGFQQLLLEPVLKFHYLLKKLQRHKEECRLLDQLQKRFVITLKAYIECNRPRPAHWFLFLKILAMLAELRSINVQHTQRLLRIQDIHPFATPLTQKLFSITNG